MALSVPPNTETIGIEHLPSEVLSQQIFGCFTPRELGRIISFVCKLWCDQADESSRLSLRALGCHVIDEIHWKKHMPEKFLKDLSFGKINYHYCIEKVKNFWNRLKDDKLTIRKNAGVSVLTIPKGISIDVYRAAFPDRFRLVWDNIVEKFGSKVVDRPYQILITNGLLETLNENGEGTFQWEDRYRDDRYQYMKTLETISRFPPHFVDAIGLAILSEKSFSIRLFDEEGIICEERIQGYSLLCVSFGPEGLSVCGNCYQNYGRCEEIIVPSKPK